MKLTRERKRDLRKSIHLSINMLMQHGLATEIPIPCEESLLKIYIGGGINTADRTLQRDQSIVPSARYHSRHDPTSVLAFVIDTVRKVVKNRGLGDVIKPPVQIFDGIHFQFSDGKCRRLWISICYDIRDV